MRRRPFTIVRLLFVALAAPTVALAQPMGAFRWQLQPYRNIITLNVTAQGGADRRVAVSGDTYRTPATVDVCNGCDVLIHEAISPAWLAAMAPARREAFEKFSAKFHTTTNAAGGAGVEGEAETARLVSPLGQHPEELNAEMRAVYPGYFIVSRDLDVY